MDRNRRVKAANQSVRGKMKLPITVTAALVAALASIVGAVILRTQPPPKVEILQVQKQPTAEQPDARQVTPEDTDPINSSTNITPLNKKDRAFVIAIADGLCELAGELDGQVISCESIGKDYEASTNITSQSSHTFRGGLQVMRISTGKDYTIRVHSVVLTYLSGPKGDWDQGLISVRVDGFEKVEVTGPFSLMSLIGALHEAGITLESPAYNDSLDALSIPLVYADPGKKVRLKVTGRAVWQ